MTIYVKNGSSYRPNDEQDLVTVPLLPVGNYVIKRDMRDMSLYFDIADPFTFPTKRYGDNTRWTQRIVDTFESRPASTGIMLTGEKGSGKSLLARTVSMEAASRGIPTIIVNSPMRGDDFNLLIQGVEQPCVVLFDEFEKVYHEKEHQEQILTLLDGVFPTQKLFLFTVNDKLRVDRHMRNRPGRIFYMIDFSGLEASFIKEYCNDNLNNKDYIPDICRIANVFTQFNFDMLKALVEEMNRYNESPMDALKLLNVRIEFDEGNAQYSMVMTKGATPVKLYEDTWNGNPISSSVDFNYEDPDYNKDEDPENEGPDHRYISFRMNDITLLNGDKIVFEKDGLKLALTRKRQDFSRNWLAI